MNNDPKKTTGQTQPHLDHLIALLRIPSVSADSAFREDVSACADWLSKYLSGLGADVEMICDYGNPLVLAEFLVDPKLPTVLLYGHYDVQPAGDRSLWVQDPFEPLIRDRKLIARGAADNKGTFMIYLAAIEGMLAKGSLPLNIKVILEGEEESTGRSLFDLVEARPDRLKADLIISTDASGFSAGKPSFVYGTRGIVYKQLEMFGPKQDIHSGTYGGVVQNPINALATLLAGLVDPTGRINIAGVYDRVRPVEPDERRAWRELEFDEAEYCRALGISQTIHEPGFSTLEQVWCRPNLTINGFVGGHTGEGAKTVLPAKAMAKISMRLVPDQQPEEISGLIDACLRKLCPPGVRLEIKDMGLAEPYLGKRTGPAFEAATDAIMKTFGNQPAMIREGGTLPIMAHFKKYLTDEILIIGLSRPDSGVHGPNEYLHLDDFERGIEMCSLLFEQLAGKLK